MSSQGKQQRTRLSAPERRELIEQAASELFAERGYRATSIDEVARRAGVTAPVVYDHFASKLELHRSLLERHYAELRRVWREQLSDDAPAEIRVPRAIDAWYAYLEEHPYASRMLFYDTTGEPEVRSMHEQVIAGSRGAIMPLFSRELATAGAAPAGPLELEMAWEAFRGVLQRLALWWSEHPEVPRERVVASVMNAIWMGLERAGRGDVWRA